MAAVKPKGYRFLVTAGNTRERIDAVRDWGNIFTGNTGFEIAKALATAGGVDLLTSNPAHLAAASAPIRSSGFTSHEDLKRALATLLSQTAYDAVFMTAAVGCLRPQPTPNFPLPVSFFAMSWKSSQDRSLPVGTFTPAADSASVFANAT